jgi:hypothetical protein
LKGGMIKETACWFGASKHSLTTNNTLPCLRPVAMKVSSANHANGKPFMQICSNIFDWRNVKFPWLFTYSVWIVHIFITVTWYFLLLFPSFLTTQPLTKCFLSFHRDIE